MSIHQGGTEVRTERGVVIPADVALESGPTMDEWLHVDMDIGSERTYDGIGYDHFLLAVLYSVQVHFFQRVPILMNTPVANQRRDSK